MAEDIADLQASEAARDAKDDAVIALVSQLQTTNAALQAEVNNLPPDNSAAIQALINDNNAYIGKLSALVTPAAPADPAPADLNPSTSDPAPEQAAS